MKIGKLLLAARIGAWIAFLSLFQKALTLQTMLRLTDTPLRRDAARLRPEELAALVDRVFRTDLLHRSCWKRAAVLRRYLLLNGVETEVAFGIRKGNETLEGHAWLERDGRPFLEQPHVGYVVTFRYPGSE